VIIFPEKMKKYFTLLFFLPFLTSAQKILPEKEGTVMYTDVVMLDSTVSKAELFDRAKAWFVSEYKSANDVIQMQDKDAGILIGKGVFDVPYVPGFFSDGQRLYVSHTVKLYFKNGKYKYEITGLSGEYYDGGRIQVPIQNQAPGFEKKYYQRMLVAVNDEILNTISSLKEAMNKPDETMNF
jgi:hypothetical protein